MKFEKYSIYGLFASLILSIMLGLCASVHFDEKRGDPAITTSSIVLRKQVAPYIYYLTPFYYPFKSRPTYLQSLYSFTQDFGFMSLRNSSGFRTPEYTVAHPANTFRVLVIGDFYSVAPSLPIEQTYSHVLQKLMNEQCASPKTEVITLSQPFYRFADDLIIFLAHGQSLKPQLVIFQISPNDLDFFDYMNIMSFQGVTDVLNKYDAKENELINPNSIDWKVFFEALETIQNWSKTNSVPVLFMFFPPVDYNKSSKNFFHYDLNNFPGLRRFQIVLKEIRKRQINFLDLTDNFRKEAGDTYLAVSAGVGEPNEYCHALVAHSILNLINEKNLSPNSSLKPIPADPTWNKEYALRQNAAADWLKFNSSYTNQMKFYESLKNLYPRDPWIIHELAEVYLSMQRFRDSYNMYKSLEDVAPNLAAPYYNLSVFSNTEAVRIKYLEQMVTLIPDHTASIEILAGLYKDTNRTFDSCRMLKRVMEIPLYELQYDTAVKNFSKLNCEKILNEN